MIFVTVGTTDFDELVAAADRLAASLEEEMVVQIGHGRFQPVHARWFRFEPSLEPYFETASLVITHGGLGTVTEVVQHGLRTVGVSNPDRFDRHQDQILQAFAEAGHLVWCRDLAHLADSVQQARQMRPRPYSPPASHIHETITAFMQTLDKGGIAQ